MTYCLVTFGYQYEYQITTNIKSCPNPKWRERHDRCREPCFTNIDSIYPTHLAQRSHFDQFKSFNDIQVLW